MKPGVTSRSPASMSVLRFRAGQPSQPQRSSPRIPMSARSQGLPDHPLHDRCESRHRTATAELPGPSLFEGPESAAIATALVGKITSGNNPAHAWHHSKRFLAEQQAQVVHGSGLGRSARLLAEGRTTKGGPCLKDDEPHDAAEREECLGQAEAFGEVSNTIRIAG